MNQKTKTNHTPTTDEIEQKAISWVFSKLGWQPAHDSFQHKEKAKVVFLSATGRSVGLSYTVDSLGRVRFRVLGLITAADLQPDGTLTFV